jgi:RHS repeat-associated protein
VTFLDGSTTLGTGTLNGGTAGLTTATLTSGPHSITASYAGDGNDAGGTSSVLTQTVNKTAPVLTLTSSANPAAYAAVTFTATLSPSTATGTITFIDGSTTLGTGTLVSGVATYNTSTLAAGTHSITASYTGDGNNSSATSSVLTETISSTLQVVTTSLPGTTAGTAYSQVFTATGGNAPYTWSISSGTLPIGLSLAANTGSVTGTATVGGLTNFTVQVTDANNSTATQSLSMAVSAVISGISPSVGSPGTNVTISGGGFGATQNASSVSFNGVSATVSGWSASSIGVIVPSGATTGNIVVTVGGMPSNGVSFNVGTSYANGYQYRQTIVLNHAKVPNTDQADFPLLFSGVYPNLANVSNSGFVQSTSGYDIVFSLDPEGATNLDHEIDSYDPTTGTASFWVRIPTLSHSTDTVIYLFYGNASITTSQQNIPGVWKNNYLSVYHLGNGTTVGLSDSGSAGYTLAGSTPAGPGKIGGGVVFNGNPGAYLYHDSVSAYPGGAAPVTLETWFQLSPNSSYEIVGYGSNSGSGSRAGLYGNGTTAFMEFENMSVSGALPFDTNWHHMVGVYSGGTLTTGAASLYVDGNLLSNAASGGTPDITTQELKIGGIPTVTSCCAMTGSVDEVRVSAGTRSPDWISTEYANESSPSTFYSVGGQSTVASAPTILFLSPVIGAIGSSVLIEGAGFQSTQGGSTVTFNGIVSTPTSWNDASVIVPVPAAMTPGNANVTVTVGGVPSNTAAFTVVAASSITQLSPTSGVAGTVVTITGSGFDSSQGSSTVSFAGTLAAPTYWSPNVIQVQVPAGATTGNVVVTVAGGASNPVGFTVTPTLGVTNISPAAGMPGTFVAITGTLFGATQETSTITFNGANVTVASWSDTSIVAVVPTAAITGTFALTVNGQVVTSPIFTVTSLPGGWADTDMGSASPLGSATYSNGTFTVSGAGEGLLGSAVDSLHYVYQTMVGDGSIVARVTSITQNGEFGVMIRETLNPSATDAFSCISTAYGAFLEYRATTGATPISQFEGLGLPIPYWVKLVRAGSTFTGFVSPDGNNWTQLGSSTTITMAQSVYVGLVVTGYNSLTTTTFDSVSTNTAATTAPQISSISATTAAVGSQIQLTGNNFGATQGGSAVLFNGMPMTIDLWSNTSIVFTVPVGATSGSVLVAVAPSMNSSNSVALDITTQPLPAPWLDADIGAVGQAGTATYSGGIFTVTGGGNGFIAAADAMHFVYQTLSGDGSIVARVTTPVNSSFPITGLMIRQTLNANDVGALVWFLPNQVILQSRQTVGTVANSQGASSVPTPNVNYWLRLVRAGTTISGFISSDGVNWLQGPTTTVSMAQNVYIGISQSGSQTATFDNVTVTVGTSPFVSGVTPVIGTIGTPVTITGSNFGQTQGTSAVTFNFALATSITSWSNSQIVAVVPPGTPNGTGPVVVTVNSIPSAATASAQFSVVDPIITSVFPPDVPLNGAFTVNGSGFGAGYNGYADSVFVNGVSAPISSWSDTQIVALIRDGSPLGAASVTVNNNGYVSNPVSLTIENTPVISSLSPTTGEPATIITIGGSGFGSSQWNSTVGVDGINAPVTSWSDSQIVASVPNIPMNGNVSVTVAGITATGPLFTYNAINQLTGSNGIVTTYNSGDYGNAWRTYSEAGPGCSSCFPRGNVSNTFDNNGNALTSTDANGNTVTYTYDANNNMTSQTSQLNGQAVTTSYTYNSFAEVLTMTDALGNTTTNTYDAKGNLLSVTSPAANGQTPPSVTQFTYNTLGELTQVLDPLSHPTTIAYYPTGLIQSIADAQNNTTTYAYDARGNRTSVIDPINGSSHPTTFTYDLMNRLTGIAYPDTTTASFGYDGRGRRITATDQNNKTTHYAYDDADRLVSVTDAAGDLTQYNYDTENNLTSITDANNHSTYFAYDSLGRVIQTTFPSTLTETYGYDQLYNLTSKTDRKGHTIQYVYDSLYRMSSKTYPDQTAANYVYDLVGKIQQVSDPTGTYGFAYDNMGRLIGTTTQYTFVPGHNFQNSYTYDAASNRTSLTAPDGSTNSYQYDALNRLTTLTNSLTGQFGFGYDALSRRTQLTRPNGVNTNYNYDSVSHLLSVLHQAGSTTLDGASYGYDFSGNRTNKTNYLNGVTSNYAYDAIYELQQVTQGGGTTESYSYDAVGNRLSSLGVPTYSYNSSNELTSTSSGSYTYDANGNTLSDPSGKSYTWDFENRLVQAVVPGTNGGTTTFRYDPFGRRIQKSALGTTNYLYDGLDSDADIVEEIDNSGNVLARYTRGLSVDAPLSMLRSGTPSYYEQDGLGSATSLSNSAGVLANTYTYDSFGKLTASTGTLTNPFQYTGRDYDLETNLRYYRARYYDQTGGRFISEDPIRFYGGDNFYRYVLNNPANLMDPTGYQEATGVGCLFGPIGCVVGGTIDVAEWLIPAAVAGMAYSSCKANQGRWHCTAKCHINNFSNLPNIPDFVTGEGWGSSEAEATNAAQKDANSRVPRGTYKRHCDFKCEKR